MFVTMTTNFDDSTSIKDVRNYVWPFVMQLDKELANQARFLLSVIFQLLMDEFS